MKGIWPQARCPDCRGPVSFWDVMSIITPFHGIYCATCGEAVFLKFPWRMTWWVAGVGLAMTLWAVYLRIEGILNLYQILAVAFGVVLAAEFVLTAAIVRRGWLVTRKPK